MKTYAQRQQVPIDDSQPKASQQASAKEVLQAYKKRIMQMQGIEDEEELLQGKFDTTQREEIDEDELLQGKFESAPQTEQEPVQREEKPNNTGLPDNLKSGIESLSGYSMDDVQVHYNSSKPAQLQALAYAQGTDIHFAPGQEQHLPHETWHVVQQMQGRVQPTTQLQGMNVNDNEGLEKEADVMGEKSLQMKNMKSNTRLVNVVQNQLVQRLIEPKVNEKWRDCLKEYLGKLDMNHNIIVDNIPEEKLEKMYFEAIKYIKSSTRGYIVSKAIEKSGINIIVDICNPEKATSYDHYKNIIYWNPFQMMIFKNEKGETGIVSSASILFHEMGHAYQHLMNMNKDTDKDIYKEINEAPGKLENKLLEMVGEGNILEWHNLQTNEYLFNEQKGEINRSYYHNVIDPQKTVLKTAEELNELDLLKERIKNISTDIGPKNIVSYHTNIDYDNKASRKQSSDDQDNILEYLKNNYTKEKMIEDQIKYLKMLLKEVNPNFESVKNTLKLIQDIETFIPYKTQPSQVQILTTQSSLPTSPPPPPPPPLSLPMSISQKISSILADIDKNKLDRTRINEVIDFYDKKN